LQKPIEGQGHLKSKKPSKKQLKIEKATCTADAQNEVDLVVSDLKTLHSPCALHHGVYCWTGHPSGEHVTLTGPCFSYWAQNFVSLTLLAFVPY
jgi:hypothetical protein